MTDRAILEAQVGRPLRADSQVVSRCHLGLPVVAEVPPILDDGTPFPTLYWLTCPLATARIGRVESVGGVRRIERWIEDEPERSAALEGVHHRYESRRDARLPAEANPAPTGGVGGARAGVKCLHAHYADHAAGNENIVGIHVAPYVEPLDCTVLCVVDGERNPAWREPK